MSDEWQIISFTRGWVLLGSVVPTKTGRVRFCIACPGASKDCTYQNDIGV